LEKQPLPQSVKQDDTLGMVLGEKRKSDSKTLASLYYVALPSRCYYDLDDDAMQCNDAKDFVILLTLLPCWLPWMSLDNATLTVEKVTTAAIGEARYHYHWGKTIHRVWMEKEDNLIAKQSHPCVT
jgi:hypothetical protein